jgi:NusA-like KH domain protein
MKAKLDIRTIQYMNLFEKTTGIKAKDCFNYNAIIIFMVPRVLISRAFGERRSNLNRLRMKMNRNVKIISNPSGIYDLEYFISAVISPNRFKKISLENDELTIFSLPRTKSVLIGRDKMRLKELSDILKRVFGIKRVVIR